MTRRRVLIITVVAVVIVLFATWLVLFLNRGDTSSASRSTPFPNEADGIAFIDEAIVYDDLGRMTATADLVVRGVVESVGPGKTYRYTDKGVTP